MNAKEKDKIATGFLYIISIFVILLLVGMIGYILYRGMPNLNVKFYLENPHQK